MTSLRLVFIHLTYLFLGIMSELSLLIQVFICLCMVTPHTNVSKRSNCMFALSLIYFQLRQQLDFPHLFIQREVFYQ